MQKPLFLLFRNSHPLVIKFAGLFLLLLLANTYVAYSQNDTSSTKMSFDFGITRDRNINLWPIFLRTKNDKESDRQILFPIYRSYENFSPVEKRTHLIPFYWKDSSAREENYRFISLYYPSLIHTEKNYLAQSRTFTLLELAPRINFLEVKKSHDGLVMENNLLFFFWYQQNQLTQKSYLVVFPAFWQFKNLPRETSIFLPFYYKGVNKQKANKTLAITPLYWQFHTPLSSSHLFLPLWWDQKIGLGTDSISTKIFFPFYWSEHRPGINNAGMFPLVWKFTNPQYNSFTLIPLFSRGNSPDGVRQHLILTPLFWHFQDEESTSNTLFPIVWSRNWQTRYEHSSSLVLFPLYWSYQDQQSSQRFFVPIIWQFSNPNYSSLTVLPFFSTGRSPQGDASHLMLTPLFWHFRSPESTSTTLLPIWRYRKRVVGDGFHTTNFIFPIYWRWQTPTYGGRIVFPVIWHFHNPEYQSTSIIPFYSKGKSADDKRSHMAISPFFWRFTTEQGRGELLFPLWWQKSKATETNDTSLSRVMLLYWNYRDAARDHFGVFPLAWRFKNQTRQSFTLFPLYTNSQTIDNDRGFTAVTPIFWKFRKPHRENSFLFPLWWSRRVGEGSNASYTRLLLPLYWGRIDSLRSNHIVFPILWSLRNPVYRSFTFVPLLSYGRSADGSTHHLVATPLFWYFQNPNGYTTTLFPLLWRGKYDSGTTWNSIFPIYWSLNNGWQQQRILFPIVWSFRSPDFNSFTLAPLFSFGKNNERHSSYLTITPLFWHFKNTRGHSNTLFPIWWSSRKGDSLSTNKHDVFFPLVWSYRKPNRTTNIVFPVYWNFNNTKRHSLTVAPFYSRGFSSNGKNHLMVTPLFWTFNSKAIHRQILFPLYTTYRDTSKVTRYSVLFFVLRSQHTPSTKNVSLLWPLVEHITAPHYRYFRVAPLVWSKRSPASSNFTIQPFYYQSSDSTESTVRILWELYTYRNQRGIKHSNGILWRVAYWDRYANGDRSFRILHLLYANTKLKGKEEKSLFPIYYYTRENNGNHSLSAMFYFYNSIKRQIPNTKYFYQEERIFWFIRLRSNYRMLKERGILKNSRFY